MTKRLFATPEETRLWRWLSKVEKRVDGCWMWTGAVTHRHTGLDYGVVKVDYRAMYVHRVFYELFVGPIPDGYEVDHLCRVTTCVNPDHLEAVTGAENRRRQLHIQEQMSRTHCPRGHPYSGDNLIVRRGKKECRTCVYARNKRNRELRKGLR